MSTLASITAKSGACLPSTQTARLTTRCRAATAAFASRKPLLPEPPMRCYSRRPELFLAAQHGSNQGVHVTNGSLTRRYVKYALLFLPDQSSLKLFLMRSFAPSLLFNVVNARPNWTNQLITLESKPSSAVAASRGIVAAQPTLCFVQ